jgi:nitric oxide reductase NorD protein
LIETRLQGILPFCVTIDREAPGYAGRRGDYALLHHSERLPEVLAAVLRRL